MAYENHDDSEDLFADTRMSFGDHLEDLRLHLLRAMYGFLFAFVIALFIAKPVLLFIAAPVEKQLGIFYDQRASQIEESLKSEKPPDDLTRTNEPKDVELSFQRGQLLQVLGVPDPK